MTRLLKIATVAALPATPTLAQAEAAAGTGTGTGLGTGLDLGGSAGVATGVAVGAIVIGRAAIESGGDDGVTATTTTTQ